MNQILAALIFFTRLPFWKIKEVPQECFKHVVSYWSFSGWLTGGMMALIFWGASTILPHVYLSHDHCIRMDCHISSMDSEVGRTEKARYAS